MHRRIRRPSPSYETREKMFDKNLLLVGGLSSIFAATVYIFWGPSNKSNKKGKRLLRMISAKKLSKLCVKCLAYD